MKKLLLAGTAIATFLLGNGEAQSYYDDKVTPEEEVNYLVQRGVLDGEGLFNEKHQLTRGEYAEWIVKALDLQRVSNTIAFKDVDYNTPQGEYIRIATDNHIINGYPDGTFKPNATLTRGQMVLLLQRAYKLSQSGNTKTFKDVPKGELEASINVLSSNGVVNGYPDNTFKPSNKVTKQHGSMFLQRTDKVYNKKLGLMLDEGVHFNLNRTGNFVGYSKPSRYGGSGYISGHLDSGKEIAFNGFYKNNYLFAVDGVKTLKLSNAYALHESIVGEIKPSEFSDHSGEYRVGIDIPEGVYSLVVISEETLGYYAVHEEFESVTTKDNIKHNSLFKLNEIAELKDGDIFIVSNAVFQKID